MCDHGFPGSVDVDVETDRVSGVPDDFQWVARAQPPYVDVNYGLRGEGRLAPSSGPYSGKT